MTSYQRTVLYYGALAVSCFLFLGSCTSAPDTVILEDLVPEGPKGYIEFYCTRCIAGWAIFKIDQGENIPVGQVLLGRKLEETIDMPLRMKRLRIAHSPGSFEFVIKLLPYAVAELFVRAPDTGSKSLQLNIIQDQLIPIRLEFVNEGKRAFSWEVSQGRAIPVKAEPATYDVLVSALNDPEWEMRWYAAQIWGENANDAPQSVIVRLNELSTRESYRECLKTAGVEECSALHEVVTKALKRIREGNP